MFSNQDKCVDFKSENSLKIGLSVQKILKK